MNMGTENTDYTKVLVIYCPCGEHYETAGHPDAITNKELMRATKNGQKVETITIGQYRATVEKFGCPKRTQFIR